MKLTKVYTSAFLLMLTMPSLAQTSAEQDDSVQMSEVIITADFYTQAIDQAAVSAAVIDKETIRQRSADHLEEVLSTAANVNFSQGASRGRYFQIRGIGERAQFIDPVNPSVGLLIDGIDFSTLGGAATTFDVDSVSIYRGPQGTEFGADALAGFISIDSIKPSPGDAKAGLLELGIGSHSSQRLGLASTLQSNDRVATRLAIQQLKSDGYVKNDFLNRDDTQNLDELTARLNVNANPTNESELQFSAVYINTDNGYDGFSLDNTPNRTQSDQPGKDRVIAKGFSFQARTEFVGFDLYTLLSHLDNESLYSYDEDWSNPSRCITLDCPFGDYSSTDSYVREGSNTVFDTRFQSNTLENTRITVGLYARERNEELFREYVFADADYYSDIKYRSYAAYGSTTFLLNDRLSVTFGGRYDLFDADFKDNLGSQLDSDEKNFAFKTAVSYDLNADNMGYGLISRGYKPGGFNALEARSLPDASLRQFENEALLNFEVGMKGLLADKKLRYALALFHQERDDVQVKQSYITSIASGEAVSMDDPCPCDFEDYLTNAAEGSNQGLELSLDYLFSGKLLGGARSHFILGLLNSEYDNFISFTHADADTSSDDPEPVDLSGREQAHAPSYSLDVGIELPLNFGQQGALSFHTNVEAKDKFYFSASHDEQSDSILLLNASVRYAIDAWKLRAWVRNITDEEVQTRGFFFGNDPADSYQARPFYQYGAPQTFGVDFTYEF